MTPEQQTDDHCEDRDGGEQYAFAQAPRPQVAMPAQDRHRRSATAQGARRLTVPDLLAGDSQNRPACDWPFSKVTWSFPDRDIVTQNRWKAGYNLRLAIGYRDTRAVPIARPAPQLPARLELASPLCGKQTLTDADAAARAQVAKKPSISWGNCPSCRGRASCETNPEPDAPDLAIRNARLNRFSSPGRDNTADPF